MILLVCGGLLCGLNGGGEGMGLGLVEFQQGTKDHVELPLNVAMHIMQATLILGKQWASLGFVKGGGAGGR